MSRPLPPFERVAHRGACREFPENTIPAFERALERGADAIELDVHATADGVVVVRHDPALAHTVEPAFRARPLAALTWVQLQAVELTPGITVPSLAQVLDLVGARAIIYVELKGRDIEAPVVDAIRSSRARCAIHSFDHGAVARSAVLAPEIPRGVLFDRAPADLHGTLARTGATAVWPHWRLADQALVDACHAAGARVITWTVNSRDAAAELAAIGVDAICSDDLRLFGD